MVAPLSTVPLSGRGTSGERVWLAGLGGVSLVCIRATSLASSPPFSFPSEHAWKWDLRVLFGVLRGSEARCFQPRKEDFAVCHYRCGFLFFPIRMTNLIQYQTLFLFCFIRIKVLTKPHDSLKTRGIAISAYSCTVFTLDAVTFFFLCIAGTRDHVVAYLTQHTAFSCILLRSYLHVYIHFYIRQVFWIFFPRFKDVSRITLSSITALSIQAFN